jgi:hypothetical protein
MTQIVEKIVSEVKTLPEAELDEFLGWLAEFEVERMDTWDKEIAADCQPGGRLQGLLDRVKDDIATGKTKARSGKYLNPKLEIRNKPEIQNPNQVSDSISVFR